MKKGILKTTLLATIVLSTFGTIAYAATMYKIGTPHTSQYVYLQDNLDDDAYSERLTYALSYWNETPTKVGIWKSYSPTSDSIQIANDSSITEEGFAVPYNPGDGSVAYYIGINKSAIDATSDSVSANYIEGVMVHEIGHIFGLDDLKSWLFDSHTQVMSYYNDLNVRYQPQSGDIEGVNINYK